MKKTVLVIMIISLCNSVQAQSTIAKLKYEQAEEAFGKNDFYTTVTKLDEVEKLLGEGNPKILYLRIMAQNKLIYEDSSFVEPLKKNTTFYLKKYDGNANLEDKYKEVFLVSENLAQFEKNDDFLAAKKYYEEKNYEAALPLYKKAAIAGYGRALVQMGVLHEYGLGVAKDNAEAFKWYTRAAEKGNSLGLYYVGRCYYHGYSVAKNATEALNYFQQSAEKNNINGMIGLADTYYHQLQNYAKSFEWFQKAASKGSIYATRMVGQSYYFGSGVTKDYQAALSWFTRGADKGDSESMNFIGVMYHNGYSVPLNYEMAIQWYLKAVEKNNYYACGNMAVLYEGGLGVKKNKKIAKEWRERQAALASKK